MDQDIGWWVRIPLEGWERLPGPRYQRLARAVAGAMERRLVGPGDRLPPERLLAAALGTSRGTAVRAYEQLTLAGLVERRQGAGTFARPRPGWTHAPRETPASALLQRRTSGRPDLIDLSLSVPAGTGHLPATDVLLPRLDSAGHGLDAAGLPELRAALADDLTVRLNLPTDAEQLVVVSGAQHALALVCAALVSQGRTVVTGCPTNPGLVSAVSALHGRLVGVPVDGLGVETAALSRIAAREPAPLVYVDPAAHSPTGAVLSSSRRRSLLDLACRSGVVVVEDVSQCGLHHAPGPQDPPLAAHDESVIAVGSLSRTFWAGLRIGWLRAPAPLRDHVLRLRSAVDVAPAVPAQLVALHLLRAAGPAWYDGLRQTLGRRRDLLLGLLARHLPAWRPTTPAAGTSLWVDLPVSDSETFAHLASGYGVLVASGPTMCVDGRHRAGLRLSFAEAPHALRDAVDRLTVAWEEHTRRLAATV